MLENAATSGITAVNLTVSSSDFRHTVENIAGWMRSLERYPEVLAQLRTVHDLLQAKRDHRLGLIFGFQDTTPFEGELDPMEAFRDLGVRIVQLTYNTRNLVGDLFDHLEHAIQVCGEDHVGIGSDLSITPIDGSEEYWSKHREFVARRIEAGIAAPNEDSDILFTVQDLNSSRRMERIADGLSSRGHGDQRIEKILGGNWLRLFREVWEA